MPFGELPPRTCGNPECGKAFAPRVPWQRTCCGKCRNHRIYMLGKAKRRRRAGAAR